MYLEGEDAAPDHRERASALSAYMWGWTFRPRLWYELRAKRRAQTKRACARANMISARPLSQARADAPPRAKGLRAQTTPARRRSISRRSARWTTRPMPPCSCAITAHRATATPASARRAATAAACRASCGTRRWKQLPDAQETLARVIVSKTRGKPLNEKDYKRLSDALLRRGFSWGEVKTALRTAGAALTDADDGL